MEGGLIASLEVHNLLKEEELAKEKSIEYKGALGGKTLWELEARRILARVKSVFSSALAQPRRKG